MENHQHEVQVDSVDEWVNLWFIGDWHIGSVACLEEKLDRDIRKIIKSPKPQIFYMGDGLNAICYRDKRFDPAEIHPRYRNHLGDIFRHQLKDVKERVQALDNAGPDGLVGCHVGNHELSCSKYFQYDPHAELLEFLGGIGDLKYSALTKFEVKQGKKRLYEFIVHTRHGVGNIRTMRSFIDRTKHVKADIKVCGHNHQLEYKRVDELKFREDVFSDGVDDSPQVWGFSGSYLRTYASGIVGYGEERGYEPVPLGCLNIKVRRDPDQPDRLEFEAKTT
jgi:hypothetical protein